MVGHTLEYRKKTEVLPFLKYILGTQYEFNNLSLKTAQSRSFV